jgi:hypothetical protein
MYQAFIITLIAIAACRPVDTHGRNALTTNPSGNSANEIKRNAQLEPLLTPSETDSDPPVQETKPSLSTAEDGDVVECETLQKAYGIVPFVGPRTLPLDVAIKWNAKQCDYQVGPYSQKQCENLHEDFNMIPYASWGFCPSKFRVMWDEAGCSQRLCRYWAARYNVIPHASWGHLPALMQSSWEHPEMNCNEHVDTPPVLHYRRMAHGMARFNL